MREFLEKSGLMEAGNNKSCAVSTPHQSTSTTSTTAGISSTNRPDSATSSDSLSFDDAEVITTDVDAVESLPTMGRDFRVK